MLKIFNLKSKDQKDKEKKNVTPKATTKTGKVRLSRKEAKEMKAKAKLEFCGNDDDLGYC